MPDTGRVYHTPVLADEIAMLAVGCRRVVDATLGGGGHAAIFRSLGAEVLGIDRDPEAIEAARTRLGGDGIHYLEAPFSSERALDAIDRFRPGFILVDLGVSSHQFDEERRGFTFRPGSPLDMRMEGAGQSAADLLNEADQGELRRIFAEYGDERRAGRLAAEIVRRRATESFRTSDHLVKAIRAALGPRTGPADFARLFQAVRIAVNDELEGVAAALPRMRDALVPGGRLAVISYHSGEDRIVKHQFREWAASCVCPPGLPVCTCRGRPLGRLDPRRAIRPSTDEIAHNPRARSATLRIFRTAET
jgi:16S rRNA (cytosine1402-N4)-methyltransferase